MKKPSLLIIILTVFLDLVGFGIVMPSLPIFAKHFNASGVTIGLLMASYSAMQFLFSPILGRLSDRVGRRPILLLSLAGSTLSYAIFAIASGMSGSLALTLLFASRIFAGIFGANITVAQAYIADITPPDQRSRKMGLIGMAFGLGFIFGPVIGFAGMRLFGVTGPGWVAAVICGLNFIFALIRLPETWTPTADTASRRPQVAQILHTLRQPRIGLLVGLFFLGTFVFSAFETTLGLLVSRNFNLAFDTAGHEFNYDPKFFALYAYCGLIGALVQGGVIGRAVKALGEPGLITLSFVVVAIGLAPMPFISLAHFGWAGLLLVLAFISVGSSLTRPPIFGMISQLSPADEQGQSIGVAQSAGSLARILGPIFGGALLTQHPVTLFLSSALISIIGSALAWGYLRRTSHSPATPGHLN
jgi:MFS family permease